MPPLPENTTGPLTTTTKMTVLFMHSLELSCCWEAQVSQVKVMLTSSQLSQPPSQGVRHANEGVGLLAGNIKIHYN